MPIIHIDILEGKTEEQKRKIAEGIADVVVKEANVKYEAIRIIFNDLKPINLAIGKNLYKDINK